MIITLALFVVLIAVAAFAKAAMDTRTFQHPENAFMSYPRWFRLWMQRRGDMPIIKIDDGFHGMQAVCFLCTGVAYFIAGALYQDLGLIALLAFPIRAIVHGIVFEFAYPML